MVHGHGATTHMTAHPSNLMSFFPINRSTRVTVGGGSSLPIRHIGHTHFPYISMAINMFDVVVSRDLTKIILSVHCLCRGNPLTIEIDDIDFSMKDARTRMVLHRCDSPVELIPVHA